MKLIIAEKPDLAQDIAKAILKDTNKENGIYKNDEYTIVSSYGHLLSLAEPEAYDERYKKWSLEDLPIYFENWKRVPGEEQYKKERLKLIGSLISNAECIIHAGDPDDEGQLLIDEIIEYFNYKGTVYRVYINDSVEKHIQKEFEYLKLNDKKMRDEGESAYARQMADKAFGINETRLATIKLQASNLSIGRVQTPTLGLVVTRDEAIDHHIKEKYYILKTKIDMENNENSYENVEFIYKPSDTILGENKYIIDQSIFDNLKPYFNKCSECNTIERDEKNYPSLPYNQTELSADMNTKYGYSLKRTLDITQRLRDKHKAITYNRSDCQYLTEDHYDEAPNVLKTVFKNISREYPVNFKLKSKCFNDSNITAHHAIIPVDKVIELNNMSEEEKNVYEAISERYIVQFLMPEINKVSTATIKIENDIGYLQRITKQVISPGFKAYINKQEKEDIRLPFVENGTYRINRINIMVEEKETKPLKYYTQGSLVKDMCSVSKYVVDSNVREILKKKDKGKKGENGSIGTVATRATIIDTLEKRGFLEMKGKNIVSTTLGREFYNLLPNEIKTPEVTAQWWLIQEDIKQGCCDHNALLLKVIDNFKQYATNAYTNKKLSQLSSQKETIGKCPKCGCNIFEGKMKNGKSMFYCENKECNFALFHLMKYFNNDLIITKSKASQLLKGKANFKIKNKSGLLYDADFEIKIENNFTNIVKLKL